MTKPVHTFKSGNGWANKEGGTVTPNHHTQAEAIEKGRAIAKRGSTEHVIHGRDGKIRDKNSYGNDPYPPKG